MTTRVFLCQPGHEFTELGYALDAVTNVENTVVIRLDATGYDLFEGDRLAHLRETRRDPTAILRQEINMLRAERDMWYSFADTWLDVYMCDAGYPQRRGYVCMRGDCSCPNEAA